MLVLRPHIQFLGPSKTRIYREIRHVGVCIEFILGISRTTNVTQPVRHDLLAEKRNIGIEYVVGIHLVACRIVYCRAFRVGRQADQPYVSAHG